jgi:hypothetical protein
MAESVPVFRGKREWKRECDKLLLPTCLVGIRKITVNQGRKVHVTAAGYKPLPAEIRSVTNLSNLAQNYTAICTSDRVFIYNIQHIFHF